MKRIILIVLCVLLVSCAGVATLPVYDIKQPTEWVSVNGRGNPMRFESEDGMSITASIVGVWSRQPRIKLVISTNTPDGAYSIDTASIVIDGNNELELVRRELIHSALVEFVYYDPLVFPKTVTVSIVEYPAFTLDVAQERCRWIGDTYANYSDCSAAAVSADRP